jgi:hypothetical protein
LDEPIQLHTAQYRRGQRENQTKKEQYGKRVSTMNKKERRDKHQCAQRPNRIFQSFGKYPASAVKTNRLINKSTGIWYGKKEKILLYRHTKKPDANYVFIVEAPHSIFSFKIIPNQKEKSSKEKPRQEKPPTGIEAHPAIK